MRGRSFFGSAGGGGRQGRFSPEEVIDALYRGLLDRPAEPSGLDFQLDLLRRSRSLEFIVYGIGHSREYFETWLRAGDLPALLANVWRSRAAHRDEPTIFLLHIMKTGGTALAESLRSVAGNRFCLSQMFYDHVVALPPAVLQLSSFVAGHLGVDALDLLPKGTVSSTVLRDPFERVLSHYAHVLADPALTHETAGLTLEEFVHAPRWRPFCENFQARSLVRRVDPASIWRDTSPEDLLARLPDGAGPTAPRLPLQNVVELSPLGLSDDELRQAAVDSLESIEVVGVSEALDDVLARLARIWSVAEVPVVPRMNVSTGRLVEDEVPPSLRVAIIEANSVDFALYEQARLRAAELAPPAVTAGTGADRTGAARPAPPGGRADLEPQAAHGAADASPEPERTERRRTRLVKSALQSPPPRWPLVLAALASVVVAGIDIFVTHGVVLIGLLVLGPCCALLGRKWRATALLGAVSTVLAAVSGVSDGLWGTASYTVFLATVAIVAVASTFATVLIQHAWPADLRISPAMASREPLDLLG